MSWLEKHGENGFIGEVGWPGNQGADGEKWNALADRWFDLADEAGLWVTVWATGEWWPSDYSLAIYEGTRSGSGIITANSQASVLESHMDTSDAWRGVNVAGGEFGTPVDQETSAFSDQSPGVYGRDYHFDPVETFDYLASRGVQLVRIPFRWERLQPRLGGELDPDELGRLRGVVSRASSAGLLVILDMHNYGAVYRDSAGRGMRCPIGSDHCPIERFADAWVRIGAAFMDEGHVIAYGLMNEPTGLYPTGTLSEVDVWHEASQQALTAIRQRGDETIVMVSGYQWSGVQNWTNWNSEPWIEDPASRIMYEAHHYFDADGSGRYRHGYSEEVAAATRG